MEIIAHFARSRAWVSNRWSRDGMSRSLARNGAGRGDARTGMDGAWGDTVVNIETLALPTLAISGRQHFRTSSVSGREHFRTLAVFACIRFNNLNLDENQFLSTDFALAYHRKP